MEDFISAIRQKALLAGKQRDPEWILDIAQASLTRDALRWHDNLDLDTQSSWPRLQKALLKRFGTTFRGLDGRECEAFIHSVRARVFDEGRESDNDWICRFVAARVVGEALRWHASLNQEVRNDWELLQQAMFVRYPTRNDEEIPASR